MERRSTEASGMISGSLRLATQPGSVSPWPLASASSGGDSIPTKVPEAATGRKAPSRIEPVDAHRVAVDQPADLGHDRLADGRSTSRSWLSRRLSSWMAASLLASDRTEA